MNKFIKLLSLWILLQILLTLPTLAQGYLNPPIYADGYVYVQPGTTVNTTLLNSRTPPSNLNALAGGNITTWNVTLPSPAFDGQLVGIGCPGGTVTTLNVLAKSPDIVQSGGLTSCTASTGNLAEYQYSLTYGEWFLLINAAPATGYLPISYLGAGVYTALGLTPTGTGGLVLSASPTFTGTAVIPYTAPGAGAVTTTISAVLGYTSPILQEFYSGSGSYQTAFVNATAQGPTYLPPGIYSTTNSNPGFSGTTYGFGQIEDNNGHYHAPLHTAFTTAPSCWGNTGTPIGAFDCDVANTIASEHWISGTATLGEPTSGYYIRPDSFGQDFWVYNSSGWNNSTSLNIGRTLTGGIWIGAYQAGQGDMSGVVVSGTVASTLSGATSWLAEPAFTAFTGGTTAVVAGVNIAGIQLNLNDSGYDVNGGGITVTTNRTNNTGALGTSWIANFSQSIGTKNINAAYVVNGPTLVGFDTVTASGIVAAVNLSATQKIVLDSTATSFGGNNLYGNVTGYSSVFVNAGGNIEFDTNSSSSAVDTLELQPASGVTSHVIILGNVGGYPGLTTSSGSLLWLQSSTGAAGGITTPGYVSVGGALSLPGISNTATTSALCYNTSTKSVSYDGTIGTCNTSSERFKHDIVPIAFDALAGVTAMRPVTFDYNADMHTPGQQLGFIAEDLDRIDSLLVGRDNEGKPNSIRFLGPMFAYVVGAEQQMQNEIVQLRARVVQLERTPR